MPDQTVALFRRRSSTHEDADSDAVATSRSPAGSPCECCHLNLLCQQIR
ncbi:MAG: hypothetical protein ACRDRX_21630 [Pseudonocardiaceae bacterium]